MKNSTRLLSVFPLLLLFSLINAHQNFWKEIQESVAKLFHLIRTIIPDRYKLFLLDTEQFPEALKNASF
ncbi:MAG: hypothetical protein ABIT58_06670 [Ferruginibacter sp.]